MARTYDNIYPTWPHDPHCACCHPNDRPYCDCACHRAPSKVERSALRLGRQVIPCRPAVGPTPVRLAPPVQPVELPAPKRPAPPTVPDYLAMEDEA